MATLKQLARGHNLTNLKVDPEIFLSHHPEVLSRQTPKPLS
jgi:hypothetical protein